MRSYVATARLKIPTIPDSALWCSETMVATPSTTTLSDAKVQDYALAEKGSTDGAAQAISNPHRP